MADVGVWDFAPAGYPTGAVSYTGPILFPSGLDAATTKIGMVVLGPGGAVANFPAVYEGPPGLPPVIDSVSVTQVPYGTTPSAPTLTLVSPGGSGIASHYTLGLSVNSGQQGVAGAFALAAATDLAGAAAVGQIPVVSGVSPTAFTLTAQKVGDLYTTSVSSVTSVTGSQTLSTLTVPARLFNWRPEIMAAATITGTVAGVQVDLAAAVGTTGGTQVGYGYGVAGVGPAVVTMIPNGVGASVSASQINAGNAATFYFQSLQIDSTGSAYSVNGSRSSFTVKVCPIP